MPGDEAVLRIVVKDEGGSSTVTGGGTTPAGGGARQSSGDIDYQSQIDEAMQNTANAGIDAQYNANEFIANKHKDEMEETARIQDQIDEAMEETANARIDAEIELQEKLKEKNKGVFEAMSDTFMKAMQGDLGGAVKGLMGKGGVLEKMGVGSEALAAAAPPIAIALAAQKAADMIKDMVVEGIRTGIANAGELATTIAGVNNDVTADMMKLDKATLGASTALAGLMQATDATAKHYEQFSSDLAMASAQADVRQTMRDITRAELLGGNLGKYVTAKSKLENDVEDIKAKLLDVLLPYITGLVERIDDGVKIAEILGTATEIGTRIDREVLAKITSMDQVLEYFRQKNDIAEPIEDPVTTLFKDDKGVVVPNL